MKKLDIRFRHYCLGLWYIIIFGNGRRLRFKFIGGEPPMVQTEDGQTISLNEATSSAAEIYEEDE